MKALDFSLSKCHATIALIAVATLSFSSNARAEKGENLLSFWGRSLPQAQIESAKDGKPVLLFFTGSDWCTPCKALKAQVTGTPRFIENAIELVHLVEVDVPQAPGIVSPEQLKANQALVDKYQVAGFPQLLFIGSDGRLLHQYTGSRSTSGLLAACRVVALRSGYLESLLKAAETADDVTKSALHAEALSVMGESTWFQYEKERAKVGEDLAGLLHKKHQGTEKENKLARFHKELEKIEELRDRATFCLEVIERKGVSNHLLDAALSAGLNALLSEGRTEDALAALATARDKGLAKPRPNTGLDRLIAELENAQKEGAASLEKFGRLKKHETIANKLFRGIQSGDLAERKRIVSEIEKLDLNPVNAQWLLIQKAFVLESEGNVDAAIASFEKAAAYPNGGVGNKNFGKEQIRRLSKK